MSAQATAQIRGSPGYREITEALVTDIRSGTWPVGTRLPPETALTLRFGVSRNTIRESLRELDQRGYIKRRRGTRSVLVTTNPMSSFINSVRSIEELLQYSKRTQSRLISVDLVVASDPLAQRLGVEPGTRWLRAQFLRMPSQGSLPIGFSEIYVDERYADIVDQLDGNSLIYRLVESRYGITFDRVEQMIDATAASPAVAGLLQVPVGSPLLAVRTEFMTRNGHIAEVGFGHFPADRYRLEIMLERSASERQPGERH